MTHWFSLPNIIKKSCIEWKHDQQNNKHFLQLANNILENYYNYTAFPIEKKKTYFQWLFKEESVLAGAILGLNPSGLPDDLKNL